LGYYAGNGIEALFGKIERIEYLLLILVFVALLVGLLRKIDVFKKCT